MGIVRTAVANERYRSLLSIVSVCKLTPGWSSPLGVENVHTLRAGMPQSDNRGNNISAKRLETSLMYYALYDVLFHMLRSHCCPDCCTLCMYMYVYLHAMFNTILIPRTPIHSHGAQLHHASSKRLDVFVFSILFPLSFYSLLLIPK